MRPHIYISNDAPIGLLSLKALRQNIDKHEHAAKLWRRIRSAADALRDEPPYTPTTMAPWREANEAKHGNRDYMIVHHTALRILRDALVCLVTQDARYREAAMRQIESVFDEKQWPDWRDKAHPVYPVDLRGGVLGRDLALAYDWLYPFLNETQRRFIIEGIDRRAIRPFFESLDANPEWAAQNSNWMTDIVGGFGIAGMALGDDHPDASRLVEYSLPKMRGYLQMYGPNGEFNESVGYANATKFAVGYFSAYRYYARDRENVLATWPFPQTCNWMMNLTVPPHRLVAFGDTKLDSRPDATCFAAVAGACGDPVLQWFYLRCAAESQGGAEGHSRGLPGGHPVDPRELLWFDASLEARTPREGRMPRGAAFPAYGGCMVSRASWDADGVGGVVYGKAGHERYHRHEDAGQLCIDAYGERLITDLGVTTPYPSQFFSKHRSQYYVAAAAGHNVFTFGDDGMIPDASGKMIDSQFNEGGAAWVLDLTDLYVAATRVRRSVGFIHPGLVAVLDEAKLDETKRDEACPIRMRWHTAIPTTVDSTGRFAFTHGKASVSACVTCLGGGDGGGGGGGGGCGGCGGDGGAGAGAGARYTMRRHQYEPPFDVDRLGEPLVQHHEPFLEVLVEGASCRLLSLFAVGAENRRYGAWEQAGDAQWVISSVDDAYSVAIEEDGLSVKSCHGGNGWVIGSAGGIEWVC